MIYFIGNLSRYKQIIITILDIYEKNWENEHSLSMMANRTNNQLEINHLEIPPPFSINETRSFNSSLSSNNIKNRKEVSNFSLKTLLVVDQVPIIDITEFRKHPFYSMFLNWSRLLCLGIIPFSLLVFFNSKIYNDINERRKRKLK